MDRDIKAKAGRVFIELFKLFAGLAIFAALVVFGAKRSVSGVVSDSLLTAITPEVIPMILSLLFTFLAFFTYSSRWGYIADSIAGHKVCSLTEYFYYFISGFFSGQFISQFGGTLVVRPGMLSRNRDISYRKAVSSVFLEKILDFIFVFILIIPSLLYVFSLTSGKTSMLLIVILYAVTNFLLVRFNKSLILFSKNLLTWCLDFVRGKPFLGRIYKDGYPERLEGLQSASLLKKSAIFYLFQLTALKYVFMFLRIYFIAVAFNLHLPFSLLFFGMPVAQLSLILAFTPGSIGVLEAGWFFIFQIFSVPDFEFMPFLIGQRIYWFAAIALFFGLSFCISWYLKFRKKVRS